MIYPPAFAHPYQLSAADNQDGTVTLRWRIDSTDTSHPYDDSDFTIERSTSSDFSSIQKSMTVSFAFWKTSYEYKDAFTNRNQGNVTFYYRIHRAHAAPTELNDLVSTTINTDYATLENFSASIDTAQHKVDLQWSYNPGLRCSDLSLVISYGVWSVTVPSDSTPIYRGLTLPDCDETTITAQLYAQLSAYSNPKSAVVTMPSSTPNVIDTLMVSAGFYNDHVNLYWHIDEDHPYFTDFVVIRTEYNSTNPSEQTLATVPFVTGSYYYSYVDNACIPGVYYEYKVVGLSDCEGKSTRAAEKTAIGFAQPYGVVSGQITYSGNQAVQNVGVYAECEDQYRGKALSFISSRQPTLEMPANYVNQLSGSSEGTFEFYLRIDNTSTLSPLLRLGELIYLYNQDNNLRLVAKDQNDGVHTAQAPGALLSGRYSHIALSYTTANSLRTVTVYVNGDSVTSLSYQLTSTPGAMDIPLRFGNDANGHYLTGYLDEIRTWNVARSASEIRQYMTTYLSGEESGLTSYYRCDDNVSRMIFDVSKSGNNYNSRHLPMSNVVIEENNVPSTEQLGHVAYTDVNGNYLFRNLPYSNQGTLYNIRPVLGIHQFSPSLRPLFFNSTSNTHNSIDFEDVSSFPVSGRVTYFNTNYPVAGCQFLIDGATLCTSNNEPIETDANGEYTISVPIGSHFIQIDKNSHVFVNGGRYPADPYGVGTTVEFLNEVTNLTFRDSTFMLVTGRLSGGSDEADKPHGFGQGRATIGQAQIVLGTPGDYYDLNTDTAAGRTFRMPQDSIYGSCHSSATTGRAHQNLARNITILTDSLTGEFNVMLPPLDYEVRSVDLVNNDGHISFNLSSIGNIELSEKETDDLTTDSLLIDSVSYAYFNYSAALDIIHYVQPVMTVHQNLDNFALGDKDYIYSDAATGIIDTIALYSVDSLGTIHYTFGYPCFSTDDIWTWQISAFEPYVNYDKRQHPDTTRQPMRGGIVSITNNFAERLIANDSSDVNDNELVLDSSGVAYYSFQVGEPNTIAPYTSTFSIYYQDADRTRRYDWSENDSNSVLVLGAKVIGTNVVTKAPDEIFFILRDPVGSRSSAQWASGETVTKTISSSFVNDRNESLTILNGYGQNTYKFEYIFRNLLSSSGIATQQFQAYGKYGGYEKASGTTTQTKSQTWTFTNSQTVSTSADPTMVGSSADVFIGVGKNRLFGDAREVYVNRDTAGNYSIGIKPVISVETEFSTQFNYSQYYITSRLIPNLEMMRNQLLTQVTASQYDTSFVNHTDDPLYITTLSPTDTAYGKNGTYLMIYPEGWKHNLADRRIFYDEVYGYNNQISHWIDALKHNEHCKVMVHNSSSSFNRQAWERIVYGSSSDVFSSVTAPSVTSSYSLLDTLATRYGGGWLDQNYTLDSGTSLSVSESRNYSSVSNGITEKDGFVIGAKTDNTLQIRRAFIEFVADASLGFSWSSSSSTQNSESSTVSYSVNVGSYDALTFDVYQSPDGFGPIFAARGGQTSCPYQGQEVTKYYQPGSEIQAATTPTIEPRITVQNDVVSNVPSGESAFFNVQLANTATATNARGTFVLCQGVGSNPNGARVSVNGYYLTQDGTTYYIYGGSSVNATVEVQQGSYDVLDYDSIQLIFYTDCYYRNADTIYISAHFVETCSEINLSANHNVLNNTTGNTVEFTINGFDQQFRNFNGIELQYQRAGDTEWHLLESFPADSAALSATTSLSVSLLSLTAPTVSVPSPSASRALNS